MKQRLCVARTAGMLLFPPLSAMAQASPAMPGVQPSDLSGDLRGDALPASLTGMPGDAGRGRLILANRQVGLCLLCHAGPFPEERFQGNLAPDLAGAGSRWSEGQLRLRVVDARRLNPQSIMPAYYRTDGLAQVGPAWRGQPILSAQQIEDVVALLVTLKN